MSHAVLSFQCLSPVLGCISVSGCSPRRWTLQSLQRLAVARSAPSLKCTRVNLRTGAWHYQLTGHKRAVDFIASLEQLLLAYPAGPIFVLVDNASIHTAKVVRKWLADHQRLHLVYLPAYRCRGRPGP